MAHPNRTRTAHAVAERRRLVESLILAIGVGGFSIVLLLANGPS